MRGIEKKPVFDYNKGMEKNEILEGKDIIEKKDVTENKDIKNIGVFFSEKDAHLTQAQKWEQIFEAWLDKIDQKRLMFELFELKLWFEGMEEFFSSAYFENLSFKYQTGDLRNYYIHVVTFSQVVGKILSHLKNLDFEKDKLFQNFEDFILEKVLENYSTKTFPYLKDVYSPESWFYELRIFMQNLRNIILELISLDTISLKAYSSLKRLYRKELMNNSIMISLLKGNFIPKMDKIYQQDICDIITSIKDKKLKRDIGIFFILAFRVLKINGLIDSNLSKAKNVQIIIPLILALKKNFDYIFSFYDVLLKSSLEGVLKGEKFADVDRAFVVYRFRYQNIYADEFPYYFEADSEKVNKRKLLKNTAVFSTMATQQLIESIARVFNPKIAGEQLFSDFIPQEQMVMELKKKLESLYTRINEYFSSRAELSSTDVLFEVNLFMETDLNYLIYKDWNDFLKLHQTLIKSDFKPEFKTNLKAFQGFIAKILNEIKAGKAK